MAEKPTAHPLKARPTVMVKPHSYQPSKAQLEADVSIPGVSPEELARNLRNVLMGRDRRRRYRLIIMLRLSQCCASRE